MWKSTWANPNRPGFARFPGVGDHGMHDTTSTRQPGRPQVCFPSGERVPTTETREEGSIRLGESDHLIVPVKAVNAAGGKEVRQ